jgi:hypothetical protein
VNVVTRKIRFERDAVGTTPNGWISTCTGPGEPLWTVELEETAPSNSKVVKQSGQGKFPLLLLEGAAVTNGFIQTKFKALAGSQDRAAGLVWRARDANNYYVMRANALEHNVVLYKTVAGVRSPIDIVGRKGGYGVSVSVPDNEWLELRVAFHGNHFEVMYRGQPIFEVEDSTFGDAGAFGLWTKADSVTLFDEVTYGDVG